MREIYLDNAATTKPLTELKKVYEQYAVQAWQNPSALYAPAVGVQKMLKQAAETLTGAFGSASHRCAFTSCGTEGANMVILRGARKKKGMNYVCGGAEHPCVEESFKFLAEGGAEVRYVRPDAHGNIDPQTFMQAVDEHTALACAMHVNNETGAKNDVAAIAAAVKAKNPQALFYADGVQAFLHERLVDTSNIDYYTVSAHKVHAHKGTGAVFYKSSAPLKPYLVGGGQENGLRSGTQNILGILSFAAAADYFKDLSDADDTLRKLRRTFLQAVGDIDGMELISPRDESKACAHILNLSFDGVAGETLLHALEGEAIYISTGSACSSKKGKSRIARALGMDENTANGAIRVSFSVFNTIEEIGIAAEAVRKHVALLRRYKRV